MRLNLYRSLALVSLFDGEPVVDPNQPTPTPPKVITQDDLNKALAEDKRRHQAQLQKVEKTYQDLLGNHTLSEQQRATLEENLNSVQEQLRTKEETAKLEKQQLEKSLTAKLKEQEANAQRWENLYRNETTHRSLQDAAVTADAFRPEQIVALLKPSTKLVEEVDGTNKPTGQFKAMIAFQDIDADGNPIVTTRSPVEAVTRMKELPEIYGNLFKSNVVSGVGANSNAGGTGPGSKVDLKNLTPQQYRELRTKNPEALGLRRKK